MPSIITAVCLCLASPGTGKSCCRVCANRDRLLPERIGGQIMGDGMMFHVSLRVPAELPSAVGNGEANDSHR